MGLPVWRAPSPAESKTTAKVDLSAASRSPIRRRRSPAPHRSATRRALSSSTSASQRSPRRHDLGFRIPASLSFDADGRRSGSASLDLPLPPVPEPRQYTQSFNEDLSTSQRPGHLRNPRRMPIIDRDDVAYIFAPTGRDAPSITVHRRVYGELPAYTPNFAPARYVSPRILEDGAPSPRAYSSEPHLSDEDSILGFPPLRRMSRRNIPDGPLPSSSLRESWSPASTVDGLGDRERSISPDSWDNMLGTVAPDPYLPSADSSFTSAAASASFSNSNSLSSSRSGSMSNSASSSRTHLTVPSRHAGDDGSGRACDTDEDSASDTEPEQPEERQTSSREVRRAYRRTMESATSNLPPARDPYRYSRHLRHRSRDASRFIRNYYSFADRAGSREVPSRHTYSPPYSPMPDDGAAPVPNAHIQDPDLEQMRSILERLTRRDDIPEEWWISAGLTPPLAERVDSVQRESQ